MKLGEKIKELRERAGLTQEELAEKMDVQRNTVWRWENQKANLKSDNVRKLANILNVDSTELIEDTANISSNEHTVGRHDEYTNSLKISNDVSYWGNFLGNIQTIANRGNLNEISSVENFLNSAFGLLAMGKTHAMHAV